MILLPADPSVLRLVAGLAVGAGTLWLLGALTLGACGVHRRKRDGRLLLDVVTGMLVLWGYGVGAMLCGTALRVWPIYAAISVLLGWTVWRRRTSDARKPDRPRSPRTPDPVVALVLMIAAGIVAYECWLALGDALWWDGWAIWGFKLHRLMESGRLPLGSATAFYGYTHPDYPPGASLVAWWLARHAGSASPATQSLIGAFWHAGLVAGVWEDLRRRVSPRTAALAALGTAATWNIAVYAIGGATDILVATALVAVVLEATRMMDEADRTAMRLPVWRFSVCVAWAVTVKQEGWGLALAAALCLALWRCRSTSRRHRARQLLPAAAAIAAAAPWLLLVYRAGLHSRWGTNAPAARSLATMLGAAIPRLQILLLGLEQLVTTPALMALPMLAALLLWSLSHSSAARGRGVRFATGILAAYTIVLVGAYAMLPEDIVWLLQTTALRVFGALVPAVGVVLALSLDAREAGEVANPQTR